MEHYRINNDKDKKVKNEAFYLHLQKDNSTNKVTYVKNGLLGSSDFIKVSNAQEFYSNIRSFNSLGYISDFGKSCMLKENSSIEDVKDTFKDIKFSKRDEFIQFNFTDYHEVLRPAVKSRLVLDFDSIICMTGNDDKDREEIKERLNVYQGLLDYVINCLKLFDTDDNSNKDKYEKYIVTQSLRTHDKYVKGNKEINKFTKVSQHVLFCETIFKDMKSMAYFMSKVKSKYFLDNNITCKCNRDIVSCTCSETFSFLDIAIYRNNNFRIPLTLSASTMKIARGLINENIHLNPNFEDEYIAFMSKIYESDVEQSIAIINHPLTDQSKNQGILSMIFRCKSKDEIKTLAETIQKNTYILNVRRVNKILNGEEFDYQRYNEISIKRNDQGEYTSQFSNMNDIFMSYLFVQYIPNINMLSIYNIEVPEEKDRLSIIDSYVDTIPQPTNTKSLNKDIINPTITTIPEKANIKPIDNKPYVMNEKHAKIENVKKCLDFLASDKKYEKYYNDRIEWVKIGMMLGHLKRYYTEMKDNIKDANSINDLYVTFSKNSPSYKNAKDCIQNLKSTTSLTHYDKKLKINSLYKLIYTLDTKTYYSILPKKKVFHTYTDFGSAYFKNINTFVECINKCVIIGQYSYLFRTSNINYDRNKSVYQYSYTELSPVKAKTLLSNIKLFINVKDKKKEEVKKKVSLFTAIYENSNGRVLKYKDFIYHPDLPSGKNKINDNYYFNRFNDIIIKPTILDNNDKKLMIVNSYIEDICGKHSNPKEYIKFYNYLLDYLSWIYANKKSSGIMLLLVGVQGSGKTLLTNFIMDIFTHENSANVSNDTFFNNKFNSQIVGKLIISIDEFKMENIARFKNLVENKNLREITQKGKDTISTNTFENYICTSNEIGQHLDSTDRRVCVIESGYKINTTYANNTLVPLLKDQDILNTFRHILVERWKNIKDKFIVSNFPISKLKVNMSENSLSDFQRFLIKEYYVLSSTHYKLKSFHDNYKQYLSANNNKQINVSTAVFKNLYVSSGLNCKRKRSGNERLNFIELLDKQKTYNFINIKCISDLCISINEDNENIVDITEPALFEEFRKKNKKDDIDKNDEKVNTPEVVTDNRSLLDKLLYTVSDNTDISLENKFINNAHNLFTIDTSKLSPEILSAYKLLAEYSANK